MYIDDVCAAIEYCSNKADLNEIYNIGTGRGSNYGDLIRYCKEKLNSNSEIKYIETPIEYGFIQARDIYLDVNKIKKLGLKPKYTVYDALDIIMER